MITSLVFGIGKPWKDASSGLSPRAHLFAQVRTLRIIQLTARDEETDKQIAAMALVFSAASGARSSSPPASAVDERPRPSPLLPAPR